MILSMAVSKQLLARQPAPLGVLLILLSGTLAPKPTLADPSAPNTTIDDGTIGCGANVNARLGPGAAATSSTYVVAQRYVSGEEVLQVEFATCDTNRDTILMIDHVVYDDDGSCGAGGTNERVLVPVNWARQDAVTVTAAFFDSELLGQLLLNVTCYFTSSPTRSPTASTPTTSPTTIAPTFAGASLAPTAAPTSESPPPSPPGILR